MRLGRALVIALLLTLCVVTVVYGAWSFLFTVYVTDTSGSARTYEPVNLGFSGNQLISSGKLSTHGLDTYMVGLKYMISTTNITAVVPSLPDNGKATLYLYTGYSPNATGFSIIPGKNGYVTISDHADTELSDNGSVEYDGYFKTSESASHAIKDGAWSIQTGSGNITFNIESGIASSITQLNQDASTPIAHDGATIFRQYAGVRIDDFQGTVDNVTFLLKRTGNPTNSLYVRVMNADTHALIGTMGSIACASISNSDATEYSFSTQVEVSSTTDIHIVAYIAGADTDGSNYVSIYYDGTANPITYMDMTTENNGVWTDVSTHEQYIRLSTDTVPQLSVTYATASGDYDIKATANSTHLLLYEGAVLKDSEALGGVSVSNTTSNIILNPVYCDLFKVSVGGTLEAWLQPNTMIQATNIPDRQSATHNGTITWGTNVSANVTYGAMAGSDTTSAVSANATGGFDMPEASIPSTWFADCGGATDLPFYSMVLNASTGSGVPVCTIYFIIILGVSFMACLLVVLGTKSAFMGVLAMIVVLFIGSSMTIVPMWIPFSLIIVDIGILFLYRQVAY